MVDLTRRELLPGMLVLGLGANGQASIAQAGSRGAAAARDAIRSDVGEAAANLRNIVRMQGSLLEEDTHWWFSGVIFAVVGEATPQPLVRFEGMETYWFSHRDDGYLLGGNTLTFFRDYETGGFLSEFKNPWTGNTDVVKPAVQGGTLGFHYGSDGIWPVRLSGAALGEPTRKPLQLQWQHLGEHVWLQHQTVYPPGMPPMHGQRQSMFANRRDFQNPRIKKLAATFSSTVFMGWLKWMAMQEQPGHVIWHAAGAKLGSLDELPAEYRVRAEREYPERMTARPAP